MSANDTNLDPHGDVRTLPHPWGADVQRREPPGEAFPPYVSDPIESPDSTLARWAREHSGLVAETRNYLGMLAQRDAPQNEQVWQNAGTLVNAGALDLELVQMPLNLFSRVHRVVVTGTPADVVTLTLYRDGAGAIGSALASWNLGALNADGVAMVEPRDLNVPRGSRVIARLRAGVSVNPIYVALYTRSYPA